MSSNDAIRGYWNTMAGTSPKSAHYRNLLATLVVVLCSSVGHLAAAAQTNIAPPAEFTITAIDVVGVKTLASAEIERTVYPFLGPGKTPQDVEAVRKAIQDVYVKRGFETVIVEVPPQPAENFSQGLVQIAVNEAPVSDVTITGSKFHSSKVVLKQLPSIKRGKPLDFKALQEELAAANRFPDRSVSPSFKAGAQPGTINVDLKVKDSLPLHSSFELNNDNSPNTTPLRLSGTVRYSDVWRIGHTLSASFVIAPQNQDESSVVSLSYSAPILGSPWTLVAFGYKSNSNIAALGGTNVLGNGYQIGGRAIYRLPSEDAYHAFSVGLDYKDFKQDIGLRGLNISSAPIRYVPLTLGYSFSKSTENAALELNVNSTLGLRVLKRVRCFDPAAIICRPEDQFTNKDVDSVENFAHLNFDATYTASFKGDWVSVTRFSGQFADSHLVTNEQFGIGGVSTVRGYFQSEAVGDLGFAGSVEFRTPSFASKLPQFVDELRFFSFIEGGIVRVVNPLPDQIRDFRLGSLGGGLRIKLFNRLSGEFLIGVPISDGSTSARGDPRYSFSVKGEF